MYGETLAPAIQKKRERQVAFNASQVVGERTNDGADKGHLSPVGDAGQANTYLFDHLKLPLVELPHLQHSSAARVEPHHDAARGAGDPSRLIRRERHRLVDVLKDLRGIGGLHL